MAASVLLDKTDRARVVRFRDGGFQVIRRGRIKNIDLSGDADDNFVATVLDPALPAMGAAYPKTELASAILDQVIVEGRALRNTVADLTLIYDTRSFGPPGTTFVLTRSSTLVEVATEIHPKNGHPLTISWTNPDDSDDVRPDDTVTSRFLAPFKRVVATAYMSSEPADTMLNCQGKVNENPWRGYDEGFLAVRRRRRHQH
jgi:hypothetical protein